MKWEYACLVKNVYMEGKTIITYTLHSPGGQQEIQGDNSVAMLNRLGQDGWEAFGVETAYFSLSSVSNLSSERSIWLKRPLNAGS